MTQKLIEIDQRKNKYSILPCISRPFNTKNTVRLSTQNFA